ncbi:MAG: hypothetical protein ACFFAA_13660 [Promethearchaeota archaeon]
MESIKKISLCTIMLIVLISGISIPLHIYYKNYGTPGDDKKPSLAYTPSGTYTFNSPIYYSCAFGTFIIDYSEFNFIDNGITLTIQPAMPGDCYMSGSSATDGQIDVSCVSPGTCATTFSLVGTFTENDTWEATFTVAFSGSCMDCTYQSWDIIGTRVDETDPIITDAPGNFTVEIGYTGVDLSWTATDAHPNTYTITLEGSGVVSGPAAWLSGTEITYNVPDGLGIGEFLYTVNFTDDNDNFIIDTINMTVIEDTTNPVILYAPSNFTVEYGYTGLNISWTTIDTNPNIYTIELQGTGIVAGPNSWSNGTEIMYNIPDGLDVGEFLYKVNFTDDYGNYVTDVVKLTVQELSTGGEEPAISFGIYYLVFLIIGIFSLAITQKRRKS